MRTRASRVCPSLKVGHVSAAAAAAAAAAAGGGFDWPTRWRSTTRGVVLRVLPSTRRDLGCGCTSIAHDLAREVSSRQPHDERVERVVLLLLRTRESPRAFALPSCGAILQLLLGRDETTIDLIAPAMSRIELGRGVAQRRLSLRSVHRSGRSLGARAPPAAIYLEGALRHTGGTLKQ